MTHTVERHTLLAGPGRISIEPLVPRAVRSGELVVRPDAVGICGTDLELLTGTMTYIASGFSTYPIVPGHEWTGIVIDHATDVTGFAVGDRVVGECSIGCGTCPTCVAGNYHLCPARCETGIAGHPGALSTWMIFPSAYAHRVPPQVSATDAALVEPLAVACRGVDRVDVRPGDALGIVGAGTIGLLCALVARARGIGQIEMIEVNQQRREFAASLGFRATPDRESQLPRVIDASGSARGIASAVDLCADGGTVVVLGLTGKSHVQLDLDALVVGDITLRGSLGSPHVWPEAIALIATGAVHPSVLISHQYAMEDAAAAFDLARSGASVRKILIRPHHEDR